ncbi:extracellular solute-binding protein [Paenibacillus pasadenensis]|nr:extracellular solute-binding protein [Paenibacillus pasadenensis]
MTNDVAGKASPRSARPQRPEHAPKRQAGAAAPRRTTARRRSERTAWALALAALLAGCSSSSPAPKVTEPEPQQALIKFVASEYSTETKPLLEDIVSGFESLHPDIRVELQVVNWDILDGVYTNMLAQGEPPDLLNANFYAHFAADGLLNDLGEILPDSFLDNLQPSLLSRDTYKGQLAALPYVASVRSLYYNQDLLEQAGIAGPPRTWSELVEDARLVREGGHGEGFGIDMTDNEIHSYLSYFFYGAGGGWIKNGRWAIDQPANVEGLELLKSMYDAGLTDAEPWLKTRDEKQRILGGGGLAMMISGNYFSSVVPKEFPGLRWGRGPIPVKDGQPPMTFGVQDVLVSFKTGHTDPAALSAFIQYLYEDERYADMVRQEGFLPVTLSAGRLLSEADAEMRANLDDLDGARFVPIEQPRWSNVMDAARKLGSAVLQGRYSPQSALEELQTIAVKQDVD